MSHFFQAPGGQNKGVQPRPPSPTEIAQGLLPGAKADAAARAGGGISPQFLEALLGQKTGTPGPDLNILQDIRNSLNLPEQGP